MANNLWFFIVSLVFPFKIIPPTAAVNTTKINDNNPKLIINNIN